MQHCTRCGAVSSDDALSCQRCGHPFDRGKQQKKQRSFLAGLLLLLGIRRDPQTGSLGCALVPAISVALVAVIIIGVIVGPVLKLIPPFAPSLTVIGTVVPGGSVTVHGTNFPHGSRINLTLDGTSIAGSITVRSDGTFDAQVSIPTSWQPNSQHVIQAQATGQDGRALAQAQQTVTMPGLPSVVTLTPGPSNTSTTTPGSPGVTPTGSSSASSCAASTTGTGTNLTFSFSGAAACPMSVVRNGACTTGTTGYAYIFHILGTVNGTLYTFIISIVRGTTGQNYTGPGTYTTSTYVVLNTGDNIGLSAGDHAWEAVRTGTVTVNSDEKSGSVDALMNQNYQTSGTVQVTGTWACSTLQS